MIFLQIFLRSLIRYSFAYPTALVKTYYLNKHLAIIFPAQTGLRQFTIPTVINYALNNNKCKKQKQSQTPYYQQHPKLLSYIQESKQQRSKALSGEAVGNRLTGRTSRGWRSCPWSRRRCCRRPRRPGRARPRRGPRAPGSACTTASPSPDILIYIFFRLFSLLSRLSISNEYKKRLYSLVSLSTQPFSRLIPVS